MARAPNDFAGSRQRTSRRAYGAAQIGLRHWLLLSLFDRTLILPQRWRVIAEWLPWAGDALGLLLLLGNLALSLGLVMNVWRFGDLTTLGASLALVLLAIRFARMCSAPVGTPARELALSHTGARAFCNGMLGKGVPCQRPTHSELAPAHPRRMLREELALLLAAWAALAAIACVHGLSAWQPVLWCAALLAQSVPYAAAVAFTMLSARPLRQHGASGPALCGVARSGAGD